MANFESSANAKIEKLTPESKGGAAPDKFDGIRAEAFGKPPALNNELQSTGKSDQAHHDGGIKKETTEDMSHMKKKLGAEDEKEDNTRLKKKLAAEDGNEDNARLKKKLAAADDNGLVKDSDKKVTEDGGEKFIKKPLEGGTKDLPVDSSKPAEPKDGGPKQTDATSGSASPSQGGDAPVVKVPKDGGTKSAAELALPNVELITPLSR